MWYLFIESITSSLRVFCNVLAFVVPYAVYKVNQKLHEAGDPPWKRDEEEEEFLD